MVEKKSRKMEFLTSGANLSTQIKINCMCRITLGKNFFVHLFSTIFHFLTSFFQGFNPPSRWNCVESHFMPTFNVPEIWSLVLFASKGIDVIVADINENGAKETIQELDKISKTTKNAAIHVDVSKIQSIEQLFKTVLETFGKPANILVNCAGIASKIKVLDINEDLYDQVMDVNLKGTYFMCKVRSHFVILQFFLLINSVCLSRDGKCIYFWINREHFQHTRQQRSGTIVLSLRCNKSWRRIGYKICCRRDGPTWNQMQHC